MESERIFAPPAIHPGIRSNYKKKIHKKHIAIRDETWIYFRVWNLISRLLSLYHASDKSFVSFHTGTAFDEISHSSPAFYISIWNYLMRKKFTVRTPKS